MFLLKPALFIRKRLCIHRRGQMTSLAVHADLSPLHQALVMRSKWAIKILLILICGITILYTLIILSDSSVSEQDLTACSERLRKTTLMHARFLDRSVFYTFAAIILI